MSESPEPVFRDGKIDTAIDVRVYRLIAVQKAAYRFAEQFTAMFGTERDHLLAVSFMFRPGTTEQDARERVRLFFEELLDQELREQIGEETRPMRALIIAQAFSRTDLVRRD